MFKTLPALVGVLAILSLPAQAQVNKCTQADGSVSYQSTPCNAGEPPPGRVTAAQLNAAQRARDQAQARAKAASEAHAHPRATASAKPPVAARCRMTPSSPPKAASGPARSPSMTKPC